MRLSTIAVLVGAGLAGLAAPAGEPAGTMPAPEQMAVDGAPAVPRDIAARMKRYGEVRTAQFADWLPGGAGMLVRTRFADTVQLHRVSAAGARREQLTFLDEPVDRALACRAKGCTWALYGADVGGGEFYQIYRLDDGQAEPVRLTDGRSRNTDPVLSPKGERLAWASTARNGTDFDLWVADPARPESARLLLERSGFWAPLDFSPDGRTLLAIQVISAAEQHLVLVDTASGAVRPLTPPDEHEVAYPAARFSPDSKRVYLITDRGWEFARLGWVAPDAKVFEPTYLTPQSDWDVETFDLAADGRSLAYATNEDGFSRLHLIDTAGKPTGKLPALPAGKITALAFQRDGPLLVIGLTSNRVPGDVWSLDPRRGQLERWTYSEAGGLELGRFPEQQLVRFPTFDEDREGPRQVPALLTLPPAERFPPPRPVLVNIHGGPEGQARPGYLGSANYRVLEMGIALLEPNVRGSTGYGKSYRELDNGKRREDAVRDIGALLDFIATRPELDAKRVAVAGGSYGGYMSLASLTTYPGRLRCGIDYVGISNFVTFLENTQAYRRDLRRVEYGDERDESMRMFLEMISPLTSAEKIRVPLLVLQGANDPRVPASEAEQIVARVRRAGAPVWYLLARDEGHGFAKKPNWEYAGWMISSFLQQHLLD